VWPVIIRRRVIVRRPCERPDRRGDDHCGGADDGARHAEWPRQWKRRAGRITPSPSRRRTPSRRGTPSRGTSPLVRCGPAARLKASEFVAVQLGGRALGRRLLLRIVLRLGVGERRSGEPGGDRGRNRNLPDTHGSLLSWTPRAKTSERIRRAKKKPIWSLASGIAPKNSSETTDDVGLFEP